MNLRQVNTTGAYIGGFYSFNTVDEIEQEIIEVTIDWLKNVFNTLNINEIEDTDGFILIDNEDEDVYFKNKHGYTYHSYKTLINKETYIKYNKLVLEKILNNKNEDTKRKVKI